MDKTELQTLKDSLPEAARNAFEIYRQARSLYERTQAAMGRRPQIRTIAASTKGVRIENG